MSPIDKLLDVRRSWPPRRIDLLVRASLLPDADARRAWSAWTKAVDFDDITWPEMRLVAFLSGRLAALDPQSPLRPRADGLARALWTRNQAKLRGLLELHDALTAQSIPSMVFKGAAVQVEGINTLRRRVMGDVDLLVRPPDILPALETMLALGWQSVNGDSRENLRSVMTRRRGLNFRKDAYAELDLHQHPMFIFKLDPAADADMWAAARAFPFAGRNVLVPHPVDSLIIGLLHGASSVGGDWVLDAVAHLSVPEFDWDRFAATVRRRGVVPNVHGGLLYLKECLDQPVPAHVLDDFGRNPGSMALRLFNWSNSRPGLHRTLVERAVRFAVTRPLRAQGYAPVVHRERIYRVNRSNPAWRYVPRRAISLPHAGAASLVQELSLPPGAPARRAILLFSLALAPPRVSRRVYFDLSVDGVGFARVRSRIGGAKASGDAVLHFQMRLPPRYAGEGRLKIEARPIRFESPMLSAQERAEVVPLPFRLVSAGLARLP